MRTPTLGYEEDTQIGKREIAQTQLKEANAAGEQSVVEESVEAIQRIREETGLAIMDNRPKKEIFNAWNNARNTIKHHNEKAEETVTINLFDEAYWMIKRALANASILGVPISNELDFENWCIVKLHL
jgi:hypothetical protein